MIFIFIISIEFMTEFLSSLLYTIILFNYKVTRALRRRRRSVLRAGLQRRTLRQALLLLLLLLCARLSAQRGSAR